MITREREPANLEMRFAELDGPITPTEKFYVRSHFPVPEISATNWRLRVEGAVARAIEFTLDELQRMPAHRMQATVECAGNNRVFLVPKVKGVQWELGAVGNAEWTGIFLRDLLERAGVNERACEVVLEGADEGTIAEAPRPAGKIHYARSLPLGKARADVLLAYAMNGEPLTPAHGFPLRAIVPGWYGMAAVKWLQRVIVTERPFHGYYQTVDYAFWQPTAEGATLQPLRELQVKAQIARPEHGDIIRANESYTVRGAAWTGEGEIVKVEVSTDGGASWRDARFTSDAVPFAWRQWQFAWQTPARPGACTLIARATDSHGRTQPRERDSNRGTYMINHWLPIEVELR